MMPHTEGPKRESSLPIRYMKSTPHDLSLSLPTDTLSESLFTDKCTVSDTPTQDITIVEPRQSNSSSRESTLVDPVPPQRPHQQLKRSKSVYSSSPSILRTGSHDAFPIPASPKISFAPLPNMEPRKRKSSAQLGVAARSRMLQQRRASRMEAMAQDDAPPKNIWKEDTGRPEEEDDGDPFVAFGQFVKVAGKGLWRKVLVKDVNKLKEKKKDKVQESVASEKSPPAPVNGVIELSRDMVDAEDHEGRVWDEEVDTTRTIRPDPETIQAEPEQQEELQQLALVSKRSSYRALPPTPRPTSLQ